MQWIETIASSSHALPPEARGEAKSTPLSFLLDAGLSPGALTHARREATRAGVSLQSVLIAENYLSEEIYYRALAKRLGLPFCEQRPDFASGALTAAALQTGVAPLQRAGPVNETLSPRWLLAPPRQGHDTALGLWPIKGDRLRSLHRARVMLTTPTRFEAWWLEAFGDPCAKAATESLDAIDPTFTARSVAPARGRSLSLGIVLAATLALGVLQPAVFWVVFMTLCGGLFALTSLTRVMALAASFEAGPQQPPALGDEDLPTYSVLVPLYREARILPNLVRALMRLDYPRAKLDVHLVVEADDAQTRAALKDIELPPWVHIRVAPAGLPRTKPRALQIALPFVRGSLLTIYDAEDEPDSDQLRRAASRFAVSPRHVACLQAQLAIDNVGDSLLTRLFGLEYAALFDVVNPGLAQLDLPIPLGGTSNHFRLSALRRVGGWDAWNVTEDADLGLRLARFGFRVEALDSTTHEEGPVSCRAWLAQRRRWLKGWMQTIGTHTRQPARVLDELGPTRAICAASILLGGVAGPLLGPIFAVETLVDLAFGALMTPRTPVEIAISTWTLFVAVWGSLALLGPLIIGAGRRGPMRSLVLLPGLIPYFALMFVAAWWAVLDLIRTPHLWAKTEHGLARTSRRPGSQRRNASAENDRTGPADS